MDSLETTARWEAPRVYIILVNWNGWRDTIECLESVFRLHYPNFGVIVCDNASTDGSLGRIAEWANGVLSAGSSNPDMRHLTLPCPKPISFIQFVPGENISLSARNERLVLVQMAANRGFAGANNVGISIAIAASDVEFVWLLNNDTVVDPNALTYLIRRMEERPGAGICGSTLLYYSNPRVVQALGGSIYNRWTARVGHLGARLGREVSPACEWVEERMNYVVGASMLVRRAFIEQVGLMDERYFLYFEEIDWITRARDKYPLAYAPGSLVYHKEGASIGTHHSAARRSSVSEFYSTRARVLFTRKYFPVAIPTVCLAILASAGHRLALGRCSGFRALVRGLLSGLAERGNLPAAK